MKEKSPEVKSCLLWIKKCMNQKLVRDRSVSMRTLKLLCLRLPGTELCQTLWSDLYLCPCAVLWCAVLWSELVPFKTRVLATAYSCTTWRKALLLALEHWWRGSGLRVWGRSCEYTEDFSMWMLGTFWEFRWSVHGLYQLCNLSASGLLRSIRCKIFRSWSIYGKYVGSQCLLKYFCFYGGHKLKLEE